MNVDGEDVDWTALAFIFRVEKWTTSRHALIHKDTNRVTDYEDEEGEREIGQSLNPFYS